MQPDITTTRYRTAPAPANLPCAENTTRTTTKHKLLTLLSFITLFSLTLSLHIFAAPPGSKYTQGETLDPTCAPTDTNCSTETTDDLLDVFTGTAAITTLGTITSGTWTGTTIAVTNGGTGATTAAAARTNLGLGNLEDSGADVINSSGGTGSFTWENINFDNVTISSKAGSGTSLILSSDNSVVNITEHFVPSLTGLDLGASNIGWRSLYLGNATAQQQLTGTFTADRTATFPDKTGTVAFTDDLIANLEDSGAGVVNSASGTGSFVWEGISLNGSTILSTSGALELDSVIGVIQTSDHIDPVTSGSSDVGGNTKRWRAGYFISARIGTGTSFSSGLTGTFTADRTATFPDKDGTVAFTDDLIANLEDDGTGVSNSAAGTGVFTWESISIDSSVINSSASTMALTLGSANRFSLTSANNVSWVNFRPGSNGLTTGLTTNPWSSVYIGNASGNSQQLTGTFTANHTATFPDKTGTVAFTDDLFSFPYAVDAVSANSSIEIASFNRTTSGTPLSGIGGYLGVGVEDDAGTLRELRINHQLNVVTTATASSRVLVQGYHNGSLVNFAEVSSSSVGGSYWGKTSLGANASAGSSHSTAIGSNATIGASSQYGIAIGANSSITGGDQTIAIGPDALATSTSALAMGYGAEAEASSAIAIGVDAGDTGSATKGTGSISIGDNSNSSTGPIGQDSIAIGTTSRAESLGAIGIGASGTAAVANYAISVGYGSSTSGVGSMTFGRSTWATAQGAIIMGHHTTTQQNSLTNSFKLMWDGTTGFHAGLTLGTQVTVNADPDTNLTDAANGSIAYDSTDHQYRTYLNGGWDALATLAGTQTLTNKTLTSPVISGGTIDNAVIGGTTAAAGSFTTGTFSGNVTLNSTNTNPYLITNRGSIVFALQAQTSGQRSTLELYTKDGDGTDDSYVSIFSKGLPTDITNRESFNFGHNTGASRFEIMSQAAGTGTVRPIHLYTGANTSQVVLNVDGSTSIATADINGGTMDNVIIGGTTAAAGSFTTGTFSGQTLIGITSARSNYFSSVNPNFQIEGTTDNTAYMGLTRNSANASGAGIAFAKSRGTTTGSNTAVVSGDLIGDVSGLGSDGATMIQAVQLKYEVDGTVSLGVVPARMVFRTAKTDGTLTEALRITSAQAVKFTNIGTTASAANAFLDSGDSNNLLRSTSSIRYKTDIQDITQAAVSNVITNLRPITYRSNAAADDPNVRWYGLIAEEVADIDPRLVHWIADEHGTAIPDGVQYERISVFLLAAAQDTEHRLSLTEASLASFDDLLADLETLDAMTLKDKLIAWFGDVGNGIGRLFAKEVDTERLCLDGLCITRTELQQLLDSRSVAPAEINNTDEENDPVEDTSQEELSAEQAPVEDETPIGEIRSDEPPVNDTPAETEEEPIVEDPAEEPTEPAVEEEPVAEEAPLDESATTTDSPEIAPAL